MDSGAARKGIVWSKFRVFKWLNKVLMRPQAFGLGHVPPLALLLLRHCWLQKQRQYKLVIVTLL